MSVVNSTSFCVTCGVVGPASIQDVSVERGYPCDKALCGKCQTQSWGCLVCYHRFGAPKGVRQHVRIFHEEAKGDEPVTAVASVVTVPPIHCVPRSERLEHKGRRCGINPQSMVNANTRFMGPQNPASLLYFQQEGVTPGNGCKGILSQVLRGHREGADFTNEEAVAVGSYLRLALGMTVREREELVTVVNQLLRVTREPGAGGGGATGRVEIQSLLPCGAAHLRAMLYTKDGLVGAMPHPKVYFDGDHAYVLATDCVADLLGHGFQVDSITRTEEADAPLHVQQISHAKRASEIYAFVVRQVGGTAVTVLWFVDWSDEFEKNDCKDNRQSIWVHAFTISTPEALVHTSRNTYLLAIGPAKANHDEVWAVHNAELGKLGQGMPVYSGATHGVVNVGGGLFARIQDNPERCATTGIGSCGGAFSSRWGWRCNRQSLRDCFASCVSCAKKRLRGTLETPEACPQCANWDFRNSLLRGPLAEGHPDVACEGPVMVRSGEVGGACGMGSLLNPCKSAWNSISA